jgi:small-conductance mechanosensitive channel
MYASVARMPTTEHVLLESDFRQVPDLQDARTVHARIEFRSRLRRRVLQLEIIDYYYLSVRSNSPSILLEYVLDLRFVDAPRRLRHIAWRWITFSLLLIALALVIASRIDSSATPWWQHDWLLPVCVTVIVVWPFATLVAVYRTTETVSLFSTHGAARLIECTGGLGTFHVFRPFMAKLAAHIRLASAARRGTKTEHLRDEMREHLRLKEIGVLSAEEYETAKVRILDQHSPTAQPSLARASTRL